MVMGRKTFESLPGLLPGRRHIVITRDRGWNAEGAEIAHSIEQALEIAGDEAVSVIGGAEAFAQFLSFATRIELTEVLAEIDGDTRMPDPRESGSWKEISVEAHPPDADRPGFRFVTLERG